MAELHIYTVSVFLSKERLAQTASSLKERGFSGGWHEISDQTGEKARLFEVKEAEYAVVFTEANGFHRDGDFEIGLTVKTEAEWNPLLFEYEKLEISLDSGKSDDGYLYAVPKNPHGPFFFIYDEGKHCKTPLYIQATIPAADFAFYRNCILPLFDSELSAHFSFEEGKAFSLQSVGTEKSVIFKN